MQPQPAEANRVHHVARIDAFAGIKIIGKGVYGVKSSRELIGMGIEVGENLVVIGGGPEGIVSEIVVVVHEGIQKQIHRQGAGRIERLFIKGLSLICVPTLKAHFKRAIVRANAVRPIDGKVSYYIAFEGSVILEG